MSNPITNDWIPDRFKNESSPHGLLNGHEYIVQWTDCWYNEVEDRWQHVDSRHVGKWGDEIFLRHVAVYGYLTRFSDAVHAAVFPSKYGRKKPPPIIKGRIIGRPD